MDNHLDVEMTSLDPRESVLNQLQINNVGKDCNDRSSTTNRDRHFSVQSLTIMTNTRESTISLLEFSNKKESLRRFFALTGNYWPKEGIYIPARAHFVVSKLAIVACAGLLAYIMSFYIRYLTEADDDTVYKFLEIYASLYLMLFLGTLSVLPAQYFNRLRMNTPAQKEDIMAVDMCLRVAYMFGLVSGLCVVGGIVLESFPGIAEYTYACAASLYVVLCLMFNMFFLMLDLKVSSLLIDQLHILADKKMLTIDKFDLVRTEIHRRVSASRLASDFVIIPSLASALGIIFTVALTKEAQSHSDNDGHAAKVYMGLAMIQLKELFYLAVAFWYVAKVNGRADELTVKLSDQFWGAYKNPNNTISFDSNAEVDHESQEKVELTDLHRMSIYMSATSRSISFTLLFKRLSWKDVLVSGIGFSVTLLLSFLKGFLKDA